MLIEPAAALVLQAGAPAAASPPADMPIPKVVVGAKAETLRRYA